MSKKVYINKKAVVEIQFNWVFMVVIGGFILAFFVGIAIFQKQASEKRFANKVLNQLEGMIVSSSVISFSVTNLSLGNIEVFFECTNCFCTYKTSLDTSAQGRQFKDFAIFSPRVVKGRKMMIMVYPWNAPFKIMNLIYVTSPEVQYIFVYDENNENSTMLKSIIESQYSILSSITKRVVEKSELSSVKYNNNYKTRFVFLETPVTSISETFKNSDVTAVYIKNISKEFNSLGKADFYKYNNGILENEGSAPVVGEASFYAVVFSEKSEDYKCNMDKAVDRLRKISNIYKDRSLMIAESFGNGTLCYGIHYYSGFDQYLNMAGFEKNAAGIVKNWAYISSRNMETRGAVDFTKCPYLY